MNNWLSYVEENEPQLIPDQNVAYRAILDSVDGNEGKIFFIDGPAGTGKTFLINLLFARVRSYGQEAIAVASTGMAATLLLHGGTAHSTFMLPLTADPQEHEEAIASIRNNEARVILLKKAVIVFWDICNMTRNVHLETVNRMLKDLRLSSKIMGGLTFVLSGDFHQILPVIYEGTQKDVVSACLTNSTIWPEVQILNLDTNMRVRLSLDPRADDFASLLLDVRNGNVPRIKLIGVQVFTLDELIKNVYPDIDKLPTKSSQWLRERMMISSRKSDVNKINWEVLKRYQSENIIFDGSHNTRRHSPEQLNILYPNGPPEHLLIIKIGVPIVLLCNLEPPRLCKGTRLRVTGFENNTIRTTILTGPGANETADIPITSMDASYIKLCFAITIHKAQGQSFSCIGVDLRNDCFVHGQLYVALSRVGRKDAQFILLPGKTTPNIVYPEVLTYKELEKKNVI